MGNNSDGVWIEEFLVGEEIDINDLKDTEKLWREIYTLSNDLYLLIIYKKYPLVSEITQHSISIFKLKGKRNQQSKIYSTEGMDLKAVLKAVKNFLKKYKSDKKEYIVQKTIWR